MGGGVLDVRREVGVVGNVISDVGTVMIVLVGNELVGNVDDEVTADELLDDELVDEIETEVDDEVGGELVDVDPAAVRVPLAAVARVLRSARVTSGSSTPLVPGMVLDSSGTVDEGNTSVRVPPPGLNTWRTATTARTASSTSGTTLFSIGSIPNAPCILSTLETAVVATPRRCKHA